MSSKFVLRRKAPLLASRVTRSRVPFLRPQRLGTNSLVRVPTGRWSREDGEGWHSGRPCEARCSTAHDVRNSKEHA